jgi:hypothetical protein
MYLTKNTLRLLKLYEKTKGNIEKQVPLKILGDDIFPKNLRGKVKLSLNTYRINCLNSWIKQINAFGDKVRVEKRYPTEEEKIVYGLLNRPYRFVSLTKNGINYLKAKGLI